MLRNAHSTVSQPRTLNALYRALSSSTPCHSAPESEAVRPKARSSTTRPYFGKNTDPSSSTTARHSSPTRPSDSKPSKYYANPRRLETRDVPVNKTSERAGKKRWDRKEESSTGRRSEPALLRPAVLSERVKAASRAGLVDEAIALVTNAPLDAQNAIVWNTLLWAVMTNRKYKLAYSLYVDMKRRGFAPNLRTYGTLFQGYAQIEDWTVYTQQLENTYKLWDNYIELVNTHKLQGSDPHEIVSNPTTAYISILGKAGQWQRFFDVYNTISLDGPLLPCVFTYTAVLEALDSRRQLPGFTDAQVYSQNASDAKLIWKQIVKASEKLGFAVDSHLARSILRILSRGGPSDHLFAYDIIREYLGLSPPGQPPVKAKIPLNQFLLEPVLNLCVRAQKPSLCLHYLQQAMETEPGVVTGSHCDIALYANAMQAAKGSLSESTRALEIVSWMLTQDALAAVSTRSDTLPLRPRLKTLRLALVACWRGADWENAARIFERLTRYDVSKFADGRRDLHPEDTARLKGRRMEPDVSTMSLLARSALASGDVAHMRQCLRLVGHMGTAILEGKNLNAQEGEHDREVLYHRATYAQAVVDLANAALKTDGAEGYAITGEEKKRWESLKKASKQQLSQHPEWRHVSPPTLEASSLGSVRGMTAMDAHVDFQMTHRHLKSSNS